VQDKSSNQNPNLFQELQLGNMDDFDKMFDTYGKIGEGNYGAVYKAKHKISGFDVAVKSIKVEENQDVMNELKNLKSCNCTYLVRYYGGFYEKGKFIHRFRILYVFAFRYN